MPHLSLIQNIAARLIGVLYAFLYFTSKHKFLGVLLSSYIKVLPLLFAIIAWIQGSHPLWIIFWIAVTIALLLIFRAAKRAGYVRFVADPVDSAPLTANRIKNDQKVPVWATGFFSVRKQSSYLVQEPANYWWVPPAEHVVGIGDKPGNYLYQFIKAGALEDLKPGYLIFGFRPQKALALSFLTTWGPDEVEINFNFYEPGDDEITAADRQTMYLTFEHDDIQQAIWLSLLGATEQSRE